MPSSQTVKKSEKFKHKVFRVPLQKNFMEKEAQNMIKNGLMGFFQGGGALKLVTVCECILNNTELHRDLQGFDLLVSDALFCGPILSDLLEIPRVELCPVPPRTGYVSFARNFPAPPSYVPVMMSGNTKRMTFLQRVKNVLMYGIQSLVFSVIFPMPFNSLKIKYNIKPERSFLQAAADYELILILADFAIDYPQPLPPCKCKTQDFKNQYNNNDYFLHIDALCIFTSLKITRTCLSSIVCILRMRQQNN